MGVIYILRAYRVKKTCTARAVFLESGGWEAVYQEHNVEASESMSPVLGSYGILCLEHP